MSDWKEDYWETHKHRGQPHLASLFAILCSVAHSAEAGADTLYITRHAGDGALLAMLNSKLSSAEFAPYADMIEVFLGATAKADLLTRPSLQKMLTNARAEHGQVDSDHPIWSAAARMFPEALDGLARAELSDLGRLPAWAIAAP